MKHCSCSYREWAGELKNEGLHALRKRPWRAWFSAIFSFTSAPRGKELATRDRPVTIQIKALKSLGDLCARPGCNQKLLLPDGSSGKRPLGFSQLLHAYTSQKALPPLVSHQASSVQTSSKSHKKCSCVSNWFLCNKERNFACIRETCIDVITYVVPSHREWGYSCSWTAHLYVFLPQKEKWRLSRGFFLLFVSLSLLGYL